MDDGELVMAQLKTHKLVASLPEPLEADSIYFVKSGTGFDFYVTNSSGTIVAYSLNVSAGGGSAPSGAFVGAPMAFNPAPGVCISNILSGYLMTTSLAAGRQEIAPFVPSHDFTIDQIGLSVGTAAAGSACGLIFDADADGRPASLLAQSADVSTGAPLTKFGNCPFTFQAGRLYWVGWWTSSTPNLRCAAHYAAIVVSWTDASTPVRQAALRRTVEFGGTSPGWTYSSDQHTSTNAPFLLFRVA